MLIHSALFWLRKDLSDADRALFAAEVSRLASLSYLARGYAGPSARTEQRAVVDNSFDFATSLHFTSMADHEFYQTQCPEHARFVATCRTFWERVVVHDIELVV
jgi:hypothetical protein